MSTVSHSWSGPATSQAQADAAKTHQWLKNGPPQRGCPRKGKKKGTPKSEKPASPHVHLLFLVHEQRAAVQAMGKPKGNGGRDCGVQGLMGSQAVTLCFGGDWPPGNDHPGVIALSFPQ